MLSKSSLSWAGISLLTVGLSIGAIAPLLPVNAAPNAQFPDTQNHWAQPFIATLAEQGIVTGYPDGTYRPEQAVDRDEFAAVLRQAFNKEKQRQLASGSVYKDVPNNYWAASAIEEAYEMGFMKGYPGGFFRPQQEVSRVEALVSLARNLNLNTSTPGTQQGAVPQTTPQTIQQPAAGVSATPQAPNRQANARRSNRKQFMYPMAMTALMQPLMSIPAVARNVPTPSAATQNQAAATPNAPVTSTPSNTTSSQPATERPAATSNAAAPPPVSITVSNYYIDAEKIPQYAVDDVANATRAGIVVNYPNPKILNPTRPATRGEVAAFIHQTLVNQGRLSPIDRTVAASNYIVGTAQK